MQFQLNQLNEQILIYNVNNQLNSTENIKKDIESYRTIFNFLLTNIAEVNTELQDLIGRISDNLEDKESELSKRTEQESQRLLGKSSTRHETAGFPHQSREESVTFTVDQSTTHDIEKKGGSLYGFFYNGRRVSIQNTGHLNTLREVLIDAAVSLDIPKGAQLRLIYSGRHITISGNLNKSLSVILPDLYKHGGDLLITMVKPNPTTTTTSSSESNSTSYQQVPYSSLDTYSIENNQTESITMKGKPIESIDALTRGAQLYTFGKVGSGNTMREITTVLKEYATITEPRQIKLYYKGQQINKPEDLDKTLDEVLDSITHDKYRRIALQYTIVD